MLPLLDELLPPLPGARYLDLGCGQGTVGAHVAAGGARVVGCDANAVLLGMVRGFPVVQARLPDLHWVRPESFDGAYAVLVPEHLEDLATLFTEVRRCVRPGGSLLAVMNHPVFTAPGAGPVAGGDGGLLWQWGTYLLAGETHEPAGGDTVTFRHRPLGTVLAAAAAGGWNLQRLIEQPVGLPAAARDPVLASQRHVPRLAGLRWRTA